MNPAQIFISYVIKINSNPLEPSGYYMYHQLEHNKTCILATVCIYVLRMILTINSDCFPNGINRFGFVAGT
jgi:hypothetical protein